MLHALQMQFAGPLKTQSKLDHEVAILRKTERPSVLNATNVPRGTFFRGRGTYLHRIAAGSAEEAAGCVREESRAK
jgi:hypothetical protein